MNTINVKRVDRRDDGLCIGGQCRDFIGTSIRSSDRCYLIYIIMLKFLSICLRITNLGHYSGELSTDETTAPPISPSSISNQTQYYMTSTKHNSLIIESEDPNLASLLNVSPDNNLMSVPTHTYHSLDHRSTP